MKGMAYHQILRELLTGLKTLEATWVSESLEAQTSPLSSPSPQNSQERASLSLMSSGSWLRSPCGKKERGKTVLGEVGLS